MSPNTNTISIVSCNKFISPKNKGNQINQNNKKLISSSNLPTANNSFYTISSLDQNELAFNDEYQDISYKNNKNIIRNNRKISYSYKFSENKIDEDIEASDENFSIHSNNNSYFECNNANNLISINNINIYQNNKTNEFKNKYKTEICKFWQLNSSCKFGEKVILLKYFFFSLINFINDLNIYKFF